MGHPAIGIEIEEKYCEIAARRLQQEALPLDVA
jgi:DNA modification methylase